LLFLSVCWFMHFAKASGMPQNPLSRNLFITMTTMAAMLGGLPLALGSGTGAELRRPLGITIVGGLMVSQLLTLYTTPVVYLYLDRLRVWSLRRRARLQVATAG